MPGGRREPPGRGPPAYRDANGDVQAASLVATMRYDGLHRRISKSIENSADWNATYNCGNMTRRHGDAATRGGWPGRFSGPGLERMVETERAFSFQH